VTEAADPAAILVVDVEPELLAPLRDFLEQQGYRVHTADSLAAARAALDADEFAVVLQDLVLPDGSGVDVLRKAQGLAHPPELVLVTGHATLDSAIAALPPPLPRDPHQSARLLPLILDGEVAGAFQNKQADADAGLRQ